MKPTSVRVAAGVSFGAVIGSVLLAKSTWGAGDRPGGATVVAFVVFFVATFTLLASALVACQRMVDEFDAAHPLRVRNRGTLMRALKSVVRTAFTLAVRASRAWLAWLPSTFAALRHEMTRETVEQWAHAAVVGFSGVPPEGVRPPREHGPLAWRVPSTHEPRPARATHHHREAPSRSAPSARSAVLTSLERLTAETRRLEDGVRA